jgi:hypothetical protein
MFASNPTLGEVAKSLYQIPLPTANIFTSMEVSLGTRSHGSSFVKYVDGSVVALTARDCVEVKSK